MALELVGGISKKPKQLPDVKTVTRVCVVIKGDVLMTNVTSCCDESS